jgi:outer membrane protein assembly factor BamB
MNRSKSLIAVGIILCLLLSFLTPLILPGNARAQPADSPWPMFGQNPQRTGRSPYSGPEVPYQKWSFTTGDSVFSSPAIGADGTIYVGAIDNKLYAINPDGSEKWSFTTGWDVFSSPAIGADGTIYVGSGDNNLYAINPDGSQKWSFFTEDWVASSPAIGADGTIYVGSLDNKLYAINPDGNQKWSFTTGDFIVSSSPAIGADGTIYVGSYDNNLYAINPDGSQKWSFTTGDAVGSSPAIGADGTIYVGSYDNNLYAITEAPDYTLAISSTDGGSVTEPGEGEFTRAGGTIYVGSDDSNLYAINPDGSQKWRFTTGDWVRSSPAIGADGTIYVGSRDGNIYAITEAPDYTLAISSTDGGSVTEPGEGTFTYDGGTTVELVAQPDEGYLFANWTGDVYTVDDVYAPATTITVYGDLSITANFGEMGPWPMFGQNPQRTGRSPYSGPEVPYQKWSFTTGDSVFSSPAIGADGTIYVGSGDNNLYAINPDGSQKWSFTTGDWVDSSPAIGADGTIYVGSDDGKLYAITEAPEPDPRCFIATAAYGTPMADEIQVLREFRDGYLLTNPAGRAFTDFYYSGSPPIAEFIDDHPALKPVVRVGLMPAVALSTVVTNTTAAEKATITGLLLLIMMATALSTMKLRRRSITHA